MRTVRIHHPEAIGDLTIITLQPRVAKHVNQVLRMKVGDPITIFDGSGYEFSGVIKSTSKKSTEIEIKESYLVENESPLSIHLAQGISKGDRMDTAIQKAVELGVSEITPVVCERTVVKLSAERSEKRLQHWNSIISSACEQSGRVLIPTLHAPTSFTDFIHQHAANAIILDPTGPESLSKIENDGGSLCLVIGPEGGFSEQELSLAHKQGAKSATLGKRILRTETAPIAAISILQARFGDF